ncbi:HAD-IA family hydrolase [Alkalisalibacterium limincola]|uniref:HAD-IA family hydrolase n=1 Tax=Alkalisalibacterium limincola TaxID=2699169 RepID=A0A5C8L087_9GAMM|nr:HAD-IA family hydrolase [Alkalisalibacterium limincola]TXK65821.1 HAD-IA family hydrolase [Alkalisalibacterium limincola]
MRPGHAVLFDLDGTLVDSAFDLHAAMVNLMRSEGRAPPPLEQFRRVVSKGARAMLALSYPDLDEDAREQRVLPFLEHYAVTVEDNPGAYNGIAQVLEAIEASGAQWGIVTNKPEALARRVVSAMGWDTRSAVLVGGDTLPVKKPDPGTLLHACKQLGVAPPNCVYVGDDERDIVAARQPESCPLPSPGATASCTNRLKTGTRTASRARLATCWAPACFAHRTVRQACDGARHGPASQMAPPGTRDGPGAAIRPGASA